MSRRRYIVEWICTAIACAFHPVYAAQEAKVSVISSRPEVVSGGEVLVEAEVPDHASWDVYLNSREVTRSFRPVEGSGRLFALLTGLTLGKNLLEIRSDGAIRSKLEIVNHPLTGPIFSGPHQEPFICQTVANGLGQALDSDCSAKPLVQYYYRSSEPTPPPRLRWALRPGAPLRVSSFTARRGRLPPM